MIAVDTNLLVWAHRSDVKWHARASKALTDLIERRQRWAIPWPCVHEFYRVVTDSRIFQPPSEPVEALGMLQAWVQSPDLSLIGEGPDHFELLSRILSQGDVRGAMVHDARVAAICIAHGVNELWSADRDFSRFPALKTRNPLIQP